MRRCFELALGVSVAWATACGGDSQAIFDENAGSSGSAGRAGSSSAGKGGTTGGAGRGGSSGSGGSVGGTLNGGSSNAGKSGSSGSGTNGGTDAGQAGTSSTAGDGGRMGGTAGMDGTAGASQDDCPDAPPAEMTACSGMLRCRYVGLTCNCMGRGEDARFECRGSGAACPSTAPENESACENPDEGPGLECPYPDGTDCRCMGEAWRCTEPPDEPGAGGAPNGPMGDGGRPDGPMGDAGRPDGPMPPNGDAGGPDGPGPRM